MAELDTATPHRSAGGVALEDVSATFTVNRLDTHSASVKWSIPKFSTLTSKATRCLWSKYFEVGGYDCRVLVYPAGDSQAVKGYVSIYIQVTDPKNAPKWDCFAAHRLSIMHHTDEAKSLSRDSWHRFSAKKKSHGWCEFAPVASILEPRQGFQVDDTITVVAEVSILSESVTFVRDAELPPSGLLVPTSGDVLSGKFTWKVQNFGLFQDMIKSQKIMSPAFPAGDCTLRLSVYQSSVNGVNYLSMCLESKDPDKGGVQDRSCWSLFRMSVLSHSQANGGKHLHRDSFGRFAADSKTGDNTSLGWNDFMTMASFTDPEQGYLVDNSSHFSATFYVIRESTSFTRTPERSGNAARSRSKHKHASGSQGGDVYQGRFTWKIEHFTRLKELLKKRKITGMCVKSRCFQVGGRECRLIIYPRGQSQPPNHLSMFLEVTEPQVSTGSWSYFVSHRLSVVNQKDDSKSVTKESQNRYSKQAKDWGWREFLTLTTLFDQDAGFLVNDAVTFTAEVLVLKEMYTIVEASDRPLALPYKGSSLEDPPHMSITWQIDNFAAFKDILETRKLFSKYVTVEGSELRLGVYESSSTLCVYLESDAVGATLEHNLWVKFRVALLPAKHAGEPVWKQSAICTKTWNNSVLQFAKPPELLEGAGSREAVTLACEVLQACPWFEFADLDLGLGDPDYASSATLSSDGGDSEDSSEGGVEEAFQGLLFRAGLQLRLDPAEAPLRTSLDLADLEVVLRERLLVDPSAVDTFLCGLQAFLDDATKLRRLLLPTMDRAASMGQEGQCLLDLLVSIPALQQPLVGLVLDVLLQCCQQLPAWSRAQKPKPRAPPPQGPSAQDSQQDAHDQRLASTGGADSQCSTSTCQAPAPPSPPQTPRAPRHAPPRDAVPPESLGEEPLAWANGLRGYDRVDEVILLGLNWLRGLPRGICADAIVKVAPGLPDLWPGITPLVHKLLALAVGMPKALQAEALLLLPSILLLPSQHAQAAGLLVRSLGFPHPPPPALRLPLLHALNLLDVSGPSAGDVAGLLEQAGCGMGAQLSRVIPGVTDMEVPQAVALAVKLSHAAKDLQPRLARTLRLRLSQGLEVAQAGGVPREPLEAPRTLDAVRLGLALDTSGGLAGAMLSEVEASLRNPDEGAATRATDIEFLMDALSWPSLHGQAQRIFTAGVLCHALLDAQVEAAIMRRRLRDSPLTADDASFLAACIADMPAGSPREDFPLGAVPGCHDFAPMLALANACMASAQPGLHAFATRLYQTLYRYFDEEGSRRELLQTLVQHAVHPPAPLAADSPRDSRLRKGASNGRKQAAGSADAAQMDTRAGQAALLALVQCQGDAAMAVLCLALNAAQTAAAQASSWEHGAHEADAQREAREAESAAAVQSMRSEVQTLQQRLDDAGTASEQSTTTHQSELASEAKRRKELGDKVANLEREVEWVLGELEEEREAGARHIKDAAARVREAEQAAARVKSMRKDDTKRLAKEKAALAERVVELEAAALKRDSQAENMQSSAASALAQHDAAVAALQERLRAAETGSAKLRSEVAQARSQAEQAEAAARASAAQARTAEDMVAAERKRLSQLYSSGLDDLPPQELAVLADVHRTGLQHIQSLQGQQGQRSEEDDSAELTGTSLPTDIDLSFMNGHESPSGQPSTAVHSHTSSHDSVPSLPGVLMANGTSNRQAHMGTPGSMSFQSPGRNIPHRRGYSPQQESYHRDSGAPGHAQGMPGHQRARSGGAAGPQGSHHGSMQLADRLDQHQHQHHQQHQQQHFQGTRGGPLGGHARYDPPGPLGMRSMPGDSKAGMRGAGRAIARQQYSPGNGPPGPAGSKDQLGQYPGVSGLDPSGLHASGPPAVNFSLLMNGAFGPYQGRGREHDSNRQEGLHTIWG